MGLEDDDEGDDASSVGVGDSTSDDVEEVDEVGRMGEGGVDVTLAAGAEDARRAEDLRGIFRMWGQLQ